ncbi:MAG: HAMP domain-containing protein [Cytophaga sp.]|nr:HAMP domain-containing protein [Undibacterium sp.]
MQLWNKLSKRLWPSALFARLTLIWIIAIMAGHLLNNAWLSYVEGHQEKIQAAYYFKTDLSNAIQILEKIPADQRLAWLPYFQRENYQFSLNSSHVNPPMNEKSQVDGTSQETITKLRQELQVKLGKQYQLHAVPSPQAQFDIAFALNLQDGTPLLVQANFYKQPQSMLGGIVIFVQILSLGLFTWLAVKQATRPLQQLANSADKLGASLHCEPLPLEGPIEVVRAAAAFNAMQKRIVNHMAERLQILAAISHDLQTPITRMRLRADLLDSDEQRNKFNTDLDNMQGLVEEGIAYARSAHSTTEALSKIDLDAMLESLVFDYGDAGQKVHLQGRYGSTFITRPNALKRLITNLVDNALYYAKDVEVNVYAEQQRLQISVLDRGPGIAEAELDKVMQPFYRLESSRNRHTGGTGLGLAIAYQLSLALNGKLQLKNRIGGGLEARLSLTLGT